MVIVADCIHLLAAASKPCVDFGLGPGLVGMLLKFVAGKLEVPLGLVTLVHELLQAARRVVDDVTCAGRMVVKGLKRPRYR